MSSRTKPDAGGLDKAAEAGIPTAVVPHRDYPDRPAFEAELDKEIRAAAPNSSRSQGLCACSQNICEDAWRDRLINIHPSLFRHSRGLHTHERAIDAGVRFSGCTVHYVRPAMDEGPIIVQAAVPVLADDDADSLEARVLAQEHLIYPLALRLIGEGKVRVDAERAIVDEVTDLGRRVRRLIPSLICRTTCAEATECIRKL